MPVMFVALGLGKIVANRNGIFISKVSYEPRRGLLANNLQKYLSLNRERTGRRLNHTG
ncbi:MAG: hypothetical protein ACI9G1_004682 [Pirellulaceae bacterium]|jgi:hypothetical protein